MPKYTQAQKLAYYKRKARGNYQGRGAYRTAAEVHANIPKSMKPRARGVQSAKYGGAIGSAVGQIGSMFGPEVGAATGMIGKNLGQFIGKKLGTYFGWGEYKVRRNSLAVPEGNSPALMQNVAMGTDTIITHREYISDIISNSAANTFQLSSFSVNPGLSTTFPWLSTIAQQYQEYEILGMIFEFKSLAGDSVASVQSGLGYIAMASNYNAGSSNYANKQQMANADYSSECKPSVSMVHIIECSPNQTPLDAMYVRANTVPSGQDIKTYDLCNFQIASSCPGTSVTLGELWVTYQIALKKPILQTVINSGIATDHYYSTTGVTGAVPMGTAGTRTAALNNSLGGTFSGQSYVFPPTLQQGRYLIIWQYTGTTGVAITYPTVTGTNCSQVVVYKSGGLQIASPVNGVTATTMALAFIIEITAPNAFITLGVSGTLPTTQISWDWSASEWAGNVAL